jgi:hypothetical protein
MGFWIVVNADLTSALSELRGQMGTSCAGNNKGEDGMTVEVESDQQAAVEAPPEPGWYEDPDNPELTRWWDGYRWGRPKTRVNRLAVAALAFAWALPIGGPPAVVLGALALQEIKDFNERGKGVAIWAILIGLLNIALVVAAIVLVIVGLDDGGSSGSLGCAAWEENAGLC